MDDRALRIAVLLAAHIIFLSAGALRIIRGQRNHLLRSRAAWYLQYYPPVVWIPFVAAYFFPVTIDLPMPLRPRVSDVRWTRARARSFRSLAVRDSRVLERLAERRDALHLKACAIQVR